MKVTRTTSNKNKKIVSVSVLSPKNSNLKRKYITDDKRANKKNLVARTINKGSGSKKVVPRIWFQTIGVPKIRIWTIQCLRKVTLILLKM